MSRRLSALEARLGVRPDRAIYAPVASIPTINPTDRMGETTWNLCAADDKTVTIKHEPRMICADLCHGPPPLRMPVCHRAEAGRGILYELFAALAGSG